MRRYLLILLALGSCATAYGFSPELKAPYAISENLQPARAQMITYRNERTALAAIADSSANYVDLNDQWRMKYYAKPTDIRTADLDRGVDLEQWGTATNLPCAWQMKGNGAALYSNEAYPFLSSKPKAGKFPIPSATECVLYARDITVPFDFTDRKLYLNIGAASGKITLYVNGKEVGFSTDSKNPAEFDISSYVERGQNRVVLRVDRFSGASWVEDQSGWRLSGVNRGVYMLAQPKIRMRDVISRTSLDPTYRNGLLETALLLRTELLNPHQVTVYYDLYDPDGKIVNKAFRDVTLGMRSEDTIRFTATIFNVRKWTSETPELYTIVYRVKREGRFTEYSAVKVGFRTVEIKGNELLINGLAPSIKGVNFEEFDPTTGNVLDHDKVRDQLLTMRRAGINAIRTGGCPMPSFFYNLTDSIGFYVINVANANTGGLDNSLRKGRSLSNNPAWRDVFVDRAITVYERTKRSASVIAVALGEDAGNGYSMFQAYRAIKERSEQTIVVYDGSAAEWNTDIYCPLYPTVEKIRNFGHVEQPIIPSRVKFDEAYWTSGLTQGAFIDRWVQPSITSDAKFEELMDDYKKVARSNGTIEISSAGDNLKAISKLFANAEITAVDQSKGIVRIKNLMQYADLSAYVVRYRVINSGKAGKWEQVAVSCAPGAEVDATMWAFGGNRQLEIEIGNIYSTILQ